MVGTKIKKCRKFWEFLANFGHFSKNIPKNEILVFFDPVGTQDAMFEINRFFQPFSSFSKVRGTQSERQITYDWSLRLVVR